MNEHLLFFTFNLLGAVVLASTTFKTKRFNPHHVIIATQLSVLALTRLIYVASSTEIYVEIERQFKIMIIRIILALILTTFL